MLTETGQRSDSLSVQILFNFISGRDRIYIQSGGFPPTFKSHFVCRTRKLEKSERRKGERNSFLAYSFPAAQTVLSGEANVELLIGHINARALCIYNFNNLNLVPGVINTVEIPMISKCK